MTTVHTPSALLTDLYQLTMGFAHWRTASHEQEAVFNLFYRKNPFGGGYAIAAGLADVADFLNHFRFTDDDIDFLNRLTGNDGKPLFAPAYVEYLARLKLTCDVDAIPEGSLVFPHQPLLRVRGPMIQCQLLETTLLNLLNFPTLIATKAARVCQAAEGEPVLEFGLRRAQGTNGALCASRAAYIGGCVATSNVQAGKLYDIPVKGTHAHSWVMAFPNEIDAFRAYAEAMPNNCTFLVDTYDTLKGVANAIEVAKELRDAGHQWSGIRLDSGDLSTLSIQARELMDAAGFPNAAIVASNDLDEYTITNLKTDGAKINVWGVGTHLVTAFDQPALGGVYKLAATRHANGPWEYKVKLSEQPSKTSTPGIQQVRRYTHQGQMMADVIYDIDTGIAPTDPCFHELSHAGTVRPIQPEWECHDLLQPIFRGGKLQGPLPSIHDCRARAVRELQMLPPQYKKLTNPEQYPVGLEAQLHHLKLRLIDKLKAN